MPLKENFDGEEGLDSHQTGEAKLKVVIVDDPEDDPFGYVLDSDGKYESHPEFHLPLPPGTIRIVRSTLEDRPFSRFVSRVPRPKDGENG